MMKRFAFLLGLLCLQPTAALAEPPAASEKADEELTAEAAVLACLFGIESKSYSVAFDFCRMAAEQGYAVAQYNLGVMYANGEGVPKDVQKAAKWHRKAAEQGHADAQTHMGPEQVAPEFPSSSSSFPFFLHVPLNTAHQPLRIIEFLGEQHWDSRTQCGVSLNEQF